jgi:hypothetical protein
MYTGWRLLSLLPAVYFPAFTFDREHTFSLNPFALSRGPTFDRRHLYIALTCFQTAAADRSFFPSTDLRLGLQQDLGQTKDSHHGHISRIRSSSSRYPHEGRPRQHVSLRAHSLEVPTNLPAPRPTAVTPRCCACPQNCETGSMPSPSTRRSYAFSRPQCPTESSAPSLLSPHAAKSITRGSRSTALSLLSISPSIAMLASRTAFDS